MAPAIFVIPLLFTAAGGSAVGAGTCGADARGCADASADTSALLQAGSAIRQRASHDQSEHDISESRSGEDARAQLLEIMRDTDADKDGKLTREELLAKVPDLYAERAVAMLERHFEAVDGDRDGAISLQELPALLQASNAEQEDGEDIAADEVQEEGARAEDVEQEGVESEEGDGMDNNEAASGLPNAGQDCWYKCGRKGGYCAWCGTGACCRKDWKTDPSECQGVGTSGSRHECVNPKTPAPTPAPTPRPTPRPTPAPTPPIVEFRGGVVQTQTIMGNEVTCMRMQGTNRHSVADYYWKAACANPSSWGWRSSGTKPSSSTHFWYPKVDDQGWTKYSFCCPKLPSGKGCDSANLDTKGLVNKGPNDKSAWCRDGSCSYSYWSGWWC